MAQIILEPRWFEIGSFREQYEGLEGALEAAGYAVSFRYEVEQRSAGAVIRDTAGDLAVHVLDQADDALIDAIVTTLVIWLKGKPWLGPNRDAKRRVWILNAKGEKLREVELPDEGGSSTAS
jgi:hypothetical protein